jgi:hypothetical protein
VWLTKSGASISSRASKSPSTRASMRRLANAIFSSADIEVSSSKPPHILLRRVGNTHDATRRSPAHWPQSYPPNSVESAFSMGEMPSRPIRPALRRVAVMDLSQFANRPYPL